MLSETGWITSSTSGHTLTQGRLGAHSVLVELMPGASLLSDTQPSAGSFLPIGFLLSSFKTASFGTLLFKLTGREPASERGMLVFIG